MMQPRILRVMKERVVSCTTEETCSEMGAETNQQTPSDPARQRPYVPKHSGSVWEPTQAWAYDTPP